jgi:hypothetical protein
MQEKKIAIAGRFPESEAEQIDHWRRMQPKIPNVSEAMRALVLLGLSLSATEPTSARKRPHE